jgi:hypothetical protein
VSVEDLTSERENTALNFCTHALIKTKSCQNFLIISSSFFKTNCKLYMSSSLNGSNKLLLLAGISVVPLAVASVLTYRYIKSGQKIENAEEEDAGVKSADDISFVKSDSFFEIGGKIQLNLTYLVNNNIFIRGVIINSVKVQKFVVKYLKVKTIY